MTVPSATDLLAQMRALAEGLPTRLPTTVRVGAGVTEALNGGKPVTRPLIEPPLPAGMDIIRDDTYPPGQWRIFDQHDEEISAGVLPVVGATVPVTLDDGSSKDMRVIAAGDGSAWLADPAVLDFTPPTPSTRWFPGRSAWPR